MSVTEHHLSKQSESVFTADRRISVEEDDRTKLYAIECPSRRHRPSPRLNRDERRVIQHLKSWRGYDELRRICRVWRRVQEERGE